MTARYSVPRYHNHVYEKWYVDLIMNEIGHRWPILHSHIEHDIGLDDLNKVLDFIYYPRNYTPGNYDRVIKYIRDNEHLHDFWML